MLVNASKQQYRRVLFSFSQPFLGVLTVPLYKCVFTFQSPGTGGGRWTEVYYRAKADLAAAATFTEEQLLARLYLMIGLNRLTKIRVSQVDNPRVTTLVNVNRQGGLFIPNVTPENSGESHVITLSSSVRPASRKLWLRGAYAEAMTRNASSGDWQITPAFQERINTWLAVLASDAFGGVIHARKKTLADGVQNIAINSVNGTAANGTSVVTTAAAVPVVAGGQVAVSGVNDRRLPGMNGSYRVISITGAAITISYTVPGDINVTPEKGFVKKLEYFEDARINAAISGWSYGGVRQTKNDFTGSRGAYRRVRTRR